VVEVTHSERTISDHVQYGKPTTKGMSWYLCDESVSKMPSCENYAEIKHPIKDTTDTKMISSLKFQNNIRKIKKLKLKL